MGIEFGGRRETRETRKEVEPPVEPRRSRPCLTEMAGYLGDRHEMEGVENRGYGGIEATRVFKPKPSLTNTNLEIDALIGQVKLQIGLNNAPEAAKEYLSNIESKATPKLVLSLLENIRNFGATFSEFYEVQRATQSEAPGLTLPLLKGAIILREKEGIPLAEGAIRLQKEQEAQLAKLRAQDF